MKKEDFEKSKWLPIFIVAVLLMLVYFGIGNLPEITEAVGHFFGVISPLLYGVLFAYFLFIPHRALEKLYTKVKPKSISKRARIYSTVTIFLLLLIIVIFILSFVLPIIFTSVIDLANSIPGYLTAILDYFDNLPEDSALAELNIADLIRDSSGDIINMIINPDGIEQAARGIISFAGGIFQVIMGLVISLYLLLERERIGEFFVRLNATVFKSEIKQNRSIKYLKQINNVLLTFIAGKGLDSVINLIVATAVLLIFDVPFALLLGLVAGLFNFIPYLGSIISAIIISIIALITVDFPVAIKVMICLLVFNQLDGNFIEPRIMKSALKISPILVIIAVVIGGAYLGIVGMFLAVPIAVIIKQLLLEYISNSEQLVDNDDRR
jgi:predicted PurR-regulated permease PerM